MNYPTQIKIGQRGFPVDYEVQNKANSSVRIRKGRVVLKLSRFMMGRKRDEVVERFLQWAAKKLEKGAGGDFVEPTYKDGGRVCTHNKIYEINVVREDRKSVRTDLIDGCTIRVKLPSSEKRDLKEIVEKIIIRDQIDYLNEVVRELNDLHFKFRFNVVRFKRMNSRFGSCSSKGNINIAYRLLFAPREVFQYVCVHELAHLKQMNHSKKFWALVGEAVPEYKEHEKWLKDSGFMLG
jgi:predicted metal-dependent hydrolase